MNSTADTARNMIRSQGTATLIATLLHADAQVAEGVRGSAVVRSWLLEELEGRYPEVTAAMDAWSDDLETEATYVEMLLASLPASALA